MLIKGNSVINLPVITVDNGKKLSRIKDLIYDAKNNQLKALLIDEGGWFSGAKVIPYANIERIGKDAVIIKSENMIRKASEFGEKLSHIGDNEKYLTKTRIITESGSDLGKVSDLIFDDQTGKVMEFEVSRGLKDFKSGKKRVRIEDIVTIGKDATVVRAYTEDRFEEQARQQGLRGAFNKSRSGVEKTLRQVKEKGRQTIYTTRDETDGRQEATDPARTQNPVSDIKTGAAGLIGKAGQKAREIQDSITEERKKDAVGKYLKVNILSPDDEVIAERGEMVTNELIEKAQDYGLLNKIINNVSSSSS